MSQLTIEVPDISCDHCKASIEGAVGDLDGVESVDVAVEARTVALRFGEPATLDAIIAAIEEQGYDVSR